MNSVIESADNNYNNYDSDYDDDDDDASNDDCSVNYNDVDCVDNSYETSCLKMVAIS